MLLSDRDILKEIQHGGLLLDPFDPERVQPASVDVTLGPEFRVFVPDVHAVIDPQQEMPGLTKLVQPPKGEPFLLHPGEFALGSTQETVTLPDYLAARLEGVSSLGRLGTIVHSTAGFIDPGFSGQVTLELANASPFPITLWPAMRIAQLCFYFTLNPAARPYGSTGVGRYQGQTGPTASRSGNDTRIPVTKYKPGGFIRQEGP